MSKDIESKLERLVQRLHGAHAVVSGVTRLTSGANLETWAFDVEVTSAQATTQTPCDHHEYILRRRAGVSGTFSIDLSAEAALLQAVAEHGVIAPPFVHLCDAADDLGEAHVTRRIVGETLGRKIVSDPRFEAVRPRLAYQCGEQLARIHATPSPIALDSLDANTVLSRYQQTYRESGAERPVLELAFRHLAAVAPPLHRAVLLHGDFRNGNLIVNERDGIAAVLDWELSHLGDPAEDLGWLCVNSWRFGVPTKPIGGFGDYAELLAGYRAAGGEDISLNRVRYWQAVGSLKWAVMCIMMYGSWAHGSTKSVERPMIGRRVSEAEIDLLNLFEAGL
jgi:aminoglycoside phosphotransferase (APT) family kinase protein